MLDLQDSGQLLITLQNISESLVTVLAVTLTTLMALHYVYLLERWSGPQICHSCINCFSAML